MFRKAVFGIGNYIFFSCGQNNVVKIFKIKKQPINELISSKIKYIPSKIQDLLLQTNTEFSFITLTFIKTI